MALQAQESKDQDPPRPSAIRGMAADSEALANNSSPMLAQATAAKSAGTSSLQGDLVQMTFTDAELQDVLRSLAALRPEVNISMDPEVTGKVPLLSLHGVTWEKALQIVADSNGLEIMEAPGNVYRVRRAVSKTAAKIAIQLMTLKDVEALSDDQIRDLLASREGERKTMSGQQREYLRQNVQVYLKELTVRDAFAVEVIQALAEKSDLNLVFTPSAKDPEKVKLASPITLKLKHMAVVDALRLVAAQGGFSCNVQNGVWVVMPRPPTKVTMEPLILETFQVNFLALDDSLIKLCQGLLSERGKASAGKNKILVVRDSSDGVEAVRRTLEAMDKPTPQVLIEARFFELNKTSGKDLGINWSQLGADGSGISLSSSFSPLDFSRDLKDSSADKQIMTATLNFGELAGIIKALEENDGARELSNPKVLVSSDEQATIHIGEQRPILKATLDASSGGGTVTGFELDGAYGGEKVHDEQLVEREKYEEDRSYTVRKGYLDLGTKLTVAPSVKTKDEVYIKVVPELTTLLGEKEVDITGGLKVEYPILFSTRVRTEFTIQSTQTIAIGGLVSERKEKSESRVPVLGYIPIFGRLFSYESEEMRRTETVIFLTVTVIPSRSMTLTSGIPVRAKLIQAELPIIRQDDAHGPGYMEPSNSETLWDQARQATPVTPRSDTIASEIVPQAVMQPASVDAVDALAPGQSEPDSASKPLSSVEPDVKEAAEESAQKATLVPATLSAAQGS
jgi:type II secretory pathway component GspD/PulD (secretin)